MDKEENKPIEKRFALEALYRIMYFQYHFTYRLMSEKGVETFRYDTIGDAFPEEFKCIEEALQDNEILESLNEKYLKVLDVFKELFDLQTFVGKDIKYIISFKSGRNATELDEEIYYLLKEVLS